MERRRFPFSHPSRTNQFRDTVSIDLSLLARSSLGGFEIIFKIIYPLSLSLFSFLSSQTKRDREFSAKKLRALPSVRLK